MHWDSDALKGTGHRGSTSLGTEHLDAHRSAGHALDVGQALGVGHGLGVEQALGVEQTLGVEQALRVGHALGVWQAVPGTGHRGAWTQVQTKGTVPPETNIGAWGMNWLWGRRWAPR